MTLSRRSLITGSLALSVLPWLADYAWAGKGEASSAARPTTRLRFNAPAKAWLEALPVGNGRLGAMVFGGVQSERLQLNHIELWSGRPVDDDPKTALAALPEVRRLLFEGRYAEANRLAQDKMIVPMQYADFGSYQMLGDLLFDFDGHEAAEGYSRQLDMALGRVEVGYRIGGDTFRRTVIASHADNLIHVRLETTAASGLSFRVRLERKRDAAVSSGSGRVHMRGKPMPYGTAFAADLACRADGGRVTMLDDGYRVEGAKSVVLSLAAATDLFRPDPAAQSASAITTVAGTPWKTLLAKQERAHRRFFDRMDFALDPAAADMAADARLDRLKAGQADNAITEAYFHLGRYLMISGSRPGSLPANLQGLWCDGFEPPWSSDYHININIQMMYWPAEVCGMSELHEPLLAYAERLAPSGARNARTVYGARGMCGHYTSNPWGHVAQDGQTQWGLWPEGLAWLGLHFWEHYAYTQDRAFLKDRAWPYLKACAEFTLDYLVEHPRTGRLVSGPATSPENAYHAPDGSTGYVTMGCTMSQTIAHMVLTHCAEAAAALGIAPDLEQACRNALDRLDTIRIGADGRILEWSEPFDEVEPGHRHISHLFGLHPYNLIDPLTTPEYAAAAAKTLQERLRHGGGQTGWSAAWLTMFRARLGQGDDALAMLEKLFRESTAPNYFDTHPMGSGAIFQMDGNMGATAAMVEMLMQSHNGQVRLLPALPAAWGRGRITGMRARGGLTIDMDWQDNRITRLVLKPARDMTVRIVPPKGQGLSIRSGKTVQDCGDAVTLKSGVVYSL